MRTLSLLIVISCGAFCGVSNSDASIILSASELGAGNKAGHQVAVAQKGSYLPNYRTLLHGLKLRTKQIDSPNIVSTRILGAHDLTWFPIRTGQTNLSDWLHTNPLQLGKARFMVPVAHRLNSLVEF